MNTIEKIQDYLELQKNFNYINKSVGMQTILSTVGPGKHYLDGWNNYAVLYIKNEMEELVKTFNSRADRVFIVEKISSLVKEYPSFIEHTHKELSKLLEEIEVFKRSKKIEACDEQMLNEDISVIFEAIEKHKSKKN